MTSTPPSVRLLNEFYHHIAEQLDFTTARTAGPRHTKVTVLLHGKPPCTFLEVQARAPSQITQCFVAHTILPHTSAGHAMPCMHTHASHMSTHACMHAHTHTHTHTHACMHAYFSTTHAQSRRGGGSLCVLSQGPSRTLYFIRGEKRPHPGTPQVWQLKV